MHHMFLVDQSAQTGGDIDGFNEHILHIVEVHMLLETSEKEVTLLTITHSGL